MGFDDICNTGLVLGLGFSSSSTTTTATDNINQLQKQKNNTPVVMNFEPSLTLSLSGETNYDKKVVVDDGDDHHHLCRQDSAASSFSNVSVKREREIVTTSTEDVETTTDQNQKGVISRAVMISDEDEDGVNGRKKLRLTKAQSAFLEESFKIHSTLNPKQKQDLARELNLRPRQVEVWFQNRRARTKLKQTEIDCEFLKKCCETLTDENRRLQKELQELKALKLSSTAQAQPFYMQLPAATLTMCPSCERIGGGGGGGGGGGVTDHIIHNNPSSKNTFNINITPNPHHLFNPFTNPSAAC